MLTQRNVDGGVVCSGCLVALPALEFAASSDPTACASAGVVYTLDLELRPIGQVFLNAPTHTSTMVKTPCTQQQYPWILATGLIAGVAYHWQVNEEANSGSIANYVAFADGGVAFVLAVGGSQGDAGSSTDAGEVDGGTPNDAGAANDAGVGDSGTISDAGPRLDGGGDPPPEATPLQLGVGCSCGATERTPLILLGLLLLWIAAGRSTRAAPSSESSTRRSTKTCERSG